MKARELRKLLKQHGCVEVRQTGSHLLIRCGDCTTIVAIHAGDIPKGTLAAIKRQLGPCIGKDTIK